MKDFSHYFSFEQYMHAVEEHLEVIDAKGLAKRQHKFTQQGSFTDSLISFLQDRKQEFGWKTIANSERYSSYFISAWNNIANDTFSKNITKKDSWREIARRFKYYFEDHINQPVCYEEQHDKTIIERASDYQRFVRLVTEGNVDVNDPRCFNTLERLVCEDSDERLHIDLKNWDLSLHLYGRVNDKRVYTAITPQSGNQQFHHIELPAPTGEIIVMGNFDMPEINVLRKPFIDPQDQKTIALTKQTLALAQELGFFLLLNSRNDASLFMNNGLLVAGEAPADGTLYPHEEEEYNQKMDDSGYTAIHEPLSSGYNIMAIDRGQWVKLLQTTMSAAEAEEKINTYLKTNENNFSYNIPTGVAHFYFSGKPSQFCEYFHPQGVENPPIDLLFAAAPTPIIMHSKNTPKNGTPKTKALP